MLKCFLLFVLMPTLCFACGTVGFSSPLRQTALSLTVAPDKPVVSAGAPLIFKVTFMNLGSKAVSVFTGANGTQAFRVSLLDSSSRTICQNKESGQQAFSIAGRYEIAPGKTAEGMYLLNRWCATLIKPGRYTLLVEFTDAWHPGPTLTAKCQFEVSLPNSEELKQALSQAAVTISDNHASGQERSIAIDVLRFSRNPESIEFIRPILSGQQAQNFIKESLMKGLALIDHVDAARLLIESYAKSDSNSQLQNTAVCALHDLQGRTKREDVRMTLDKFMQEHPRPCAKIID